MGHEKLKSMSCPFTWGMENVIENRNRLLEAGENRFDTVVDLQDTFPEFVFVYHVMLAYENFMIDVLPGAMRSVEDAEISLADIKKQGVLRDVENTLQHIFVATKCHLLEDEGETSRVDELLDGVTQVVDLDAAESAVLSGCQCLGWSLYYATDNMMAIKHAREAIEREPDNGKWHFLLGKNCRRLRRRHDCIGVRPTPEETLAFENAFHLSKNVLFGVSLAQMYRESGNRYKANEVYRKVYELRPTCCKVRLQLALGFIRAKDPRLAKNCLDYVAERMPDSPIFVHYKAIYEEKCNRDFKAALPYYESAIEKKNFVAEWQYVQCKKEVQPSWDPLPYLFSLLEKYDRDVDHVIQGIHIQIGAYHLFETSDIPAACISLTKAIEISPKARLLTEHFVLFHGYKVVNLYHVLAKEIQYALDSATHEEENSLLKDTLVLCREHCQDLPDDLSSHLKAISSSKSRGSYGNYGRGSSARAGISFGVERAGLASRGLAKNHPQRGSGDIRNPAKESSRLFQAREETSWRSSGQTDRLPRGQPGHVFEYDKYSSSRDRVRGRDPRATPASKAGDENDEDGADALCVLVKTLKKLNI